MTTPSEANNTRLKSRSLVNPLIGSSAHELYDVSLHVPKPSFLHLYSWPFFLIYAIWAYTVFIAYDGNDAAFEVGMLSLGVLGVINALTVLACQWSVYIKVLFTCSSVKDISTAKLVRAVPYPNCGTSDLCPLVFEKSLDPNQKEPDVCFYFQKTRYAYDREKKSFGTIDFPVNYPMSYYRESKGLISESEVAVSERKYGKNNFDIPIPPFGVLFKEQATAPFFVFQVFCVGLWCLDEYWYYSLFTLFMLVIFEATVVQQRLRNLRELRQMRIKPYKIYVMREKKWVQMMTDQLLPGDIVSVVRPSDDSVVPCDLLLLAGTCIVNEAMLTGESVPQMKEPLNPSNSDENLDLSKNSKLSLLFGGTKIVQHTTPEKSNSSEEKSLRNAPDTGCLAYVLRTGFDTAQGKLVRTILFSTERVTANTLESFLFILFLLFFAVSASAYVWIYGAEKNPNRSTYKLLLDCVLIITSVVPPELPMELSLAVNSSLIALSKFAIFCTEPFRIPYAGKIDVCCFDKTGTLTSNDLVVEGIAGLGSKPDELILLDSATDHTVHILASCHSLVHVDDDLIGDPMEKATLNAVNWNLSKGDVASPRKGKRQSIKILQRFHFSSALKRMSALCTLDSDGVSTHIVTVKGAPEIIAKMLDSIPVEYENVHKSYARKGARVLALAHKTIKVEVQSQLRDLKREDLECKLTFAGFLILSCPLKTDAQESLKMIKESSHLMVMITGDNPLTACHVAIDVHMSSKPFLILGGGEVELHASSQNLTWQSVDETDKYDFDDVTPATEKGRGILKKYNLCVTGAGMRSLSQASKSFTALLRYIRVYARVAPEQKELVIIALKTAGFITLMCGDGTNDVGALKQAHVGIALLDGTPESLKKERDRLIAIRREKVREMSERFAAKFNQGRTPPQAQAQLTEKMTKAQTMMSEMEDLDVPLVKLGDASIASPFTSKLRHVNSVCHILRQGRCTLVTTLQMFRILALNCLITAYSLSVLSLDGIKYGDLQATIQGMLLAACFLFISRSQPLERLSPQRPLHNIFNPYMLLTVLSQFAIHLTSLIYIVKEAKRISGITDETKVDFEKEFEETLLNSSVFIVAMGMQVSTFAINYQGHPFMQSMSDNRPLRLSITAAFGMIALIASGISPDISKQLQIVDFEAYDPNFRQTLLQVVAFDLCGAYVMDRILAKFLAYRQPQTYD